MEIDFEIKRKACFSRIKKEIRDKHTCAWLLLIVSCILAIMSSYYISYYSFITNISHQTQIRITYMFMLIASSFSIGYISAFIFYYFHDYLPMASKMLEDYQSAYVIEKTIYDSCCSVEKLGLMNDAPQKDYEEVFANNIVESKITDKLMSLQPQFWSIIRLNTTIISDGVGSLRLLCQDVVPAALIIMTMSLDIYNQIKQKNWALYNNDEPKVEYDDLLLVIRNFKKSLIDYKCILDETEKYVYIDVN